MLGYLIVPPALAGAFAARTAAQAGEDDDDFINQVMETAARTAYKEAVVT